MTSSRIAICACVLGTLSGLAWDEANAQFTIRLNTQNQRAQNQPRPAPAPPVARPASPAPPADGRVQTFQVKGPGGIVEQRTRTLPSESSNKNELANWADPSLMDGQRSVAPNESALVNRDTQWATRNRVDWSRPNTTPAPRSVHESTLRNRAPEWSRVAETDWRSTDTFDQRPTLVSHRPQPSAFDEVLLSHRRQQEVLRHSTRRHTVASQPPVGMPRTATVSAPIRIFCPAGEAGACAYSLNASFGNFDYQIRAGQQQSFQGTTPWAVTYHNGSQQVRYPLQAGQEYFFQRTTSGTWQLYRLGT